MTQRTEDNYPEPMVDDFRDADGYIDYEEYDYYHTQWEDTQQWLEAHKALTQSEQGAMLIA